MSIHDHDAMAIAAPMVRKHEGLRLKPYRCTAGKLTIGYGRNLDDVGITEREADILLSADLADAHDDLVNFSWWAGLSPQRKAAMIDMRFNLGPGRFRGFRKMLGALSDGDYDAAARELLESRYAQQVGQRAETLAELIECG